MDWRAVGSGIAHDVTEIAQAGVLGWVVLAALSLLPVAAVVVGRRSVLAWVAVAMWSVPIVVWVLYYGRHWPNAGLEGGATIALFVPAAWLILGGAVLHGRSKHRGAVASDAASSMGSGA